MSDPKSISIRKGSSHGSLKNKDTGTIPKNAQFTPPSSPWQIRVESARLEMKLSFEQLAKLIPGQTQAKLWRYLRSSSGLPAVSKFDPDVQLPHYAKALKIPLAELREAYNCSMMLHHDALIVPKEEQKPLEAMERKISKDPRPRIPISEVRAMLDEFRPEIEEDESEQKPKYHFEFREKVKKFAINDTGNFRYEPWSPFQILIADYVETEHGGITDFCKSLGISRSTYQTWTRNDKGYPHTKSFDPDKMIPKIASYVGRSEDYVFQAFDVSRIGTTEIPDSKKMLSRFDEIGKLLPKSISDPSQCPKLDLLSIISWFIYLGNPRP